VQSVALRLGIEKCVSLMSIKLLPFHISRKNYEYEYEYKYNPHSHVAVINSMCNNNNNENFHANEQHANCTNV